MPDCCAGVGGFGVTGSISAVGMGMVGDAACGDDDGIGNASFVIDSTAVGNMPDSW